MFPEPKLIVIPVQTPTIVPPASLAYLAQIKIIAIANMCAGKTPKILKSFNDNNKSEKLIIKAIASLEVNAEKPPLKDKTALDSKNKYAAAAPNKLSEKHNKREVKLIFSAKATASPVTKRQINVERIGVIIFSRISLNGFNAPKITTNAKIDAMYLNDDIESPLKIYPRAEPKAEITKYFLPPEAEKATPKGEKVVLNPEKLNTIPNKKLARILKIDFLFKFIFFLSLIKLTVSVTLIILFSFFYFIFYNFTKNKIKNRSYYVVKIYCFML
jgi:hypothetical protein